jgi:hypothetical protein
MPAGSSRSAEPGGSSDGPSDGLPVTWRPIGPRIAAVAAGAALAVIFTFLWFGFEQEVRDSVTPFQRGTVIGMFVLGGACLNAIARSRAVARADGLEVVNGYRRHHYAWAEIVAVRLSPGAPWATLDLADGTTASVMAIQGSDGERARAAVRQLRALVDRPDAPRD